MLEGFNYAPGFTNWKVFGNDMNEYNHYEQVPEGLKYGKQIHCGMFPDEVFNKKNNLNFCLRILAALNFVSFSICVQFPFFTMFENH